MAIKVAMAAALLVALVAVTGATTYTTTITTTSFDNDVYRPGQQCSQVVQQRQFQACQDYLSPRSPYLEVIGMRSVNPSRQEEQQKRDECCQSLKEMESQGCECEAIKRAVQKVQDREMGQGQQMGQQSEQVYQKAKRLPQTCNLKTQECGFQVVFL